MKSEWFAAHDTQFIISQESRFCLSVFVCSGFWSETQRQGGLVLLSDWKHLRFRLEASRIPTGTIRSSDWKHSEFRQRAFTILTARNKKNRCRLNEIILIISTKMSKMDKSLFHESICHERTPTWTYSIHPVRSAFTHYEYFTKP